MSQSNVPRNINASTVSQSSPHPMLTIPELIMEFLGHLHAEDEGHVGWIDTAGLVCKSWIIPAKVVKWGTADLRRLLSVLAPIRIWEDEYTGIALIDFARRPKLDDWKRFGDVANLVFTLDVSGEMRLEGPLLTMLLTTLNRRRPPHSSALLPNTRTLKTGPLMVNDLKEILSLLPPTLQTLDTTLYASDEDAKLAFLQLIPQRFPTLSTLRLAGMWDGNEKLHQAMADMLTQLQSLREVSIPNMNFTSGIASALSTLPELRRVEVGQDCVENKELNLKWEGSSGGFPKLARLDVHIPFDDASSSFLLDISSINSLQSLKLAHNVQQDGTGDLDGVFRAIGQMHGLRHLALTSVRVELLQADSLQGLMRCEALESLELSISATTTQITNEGIAAALRPLTHLKRLELCVLQGHKSVLDLHTLTSILQSSPSLEHVVLELDVRSQWALQPNRHQHDNLHTLDFVNVPGSRRGFELHRQPIQEMAAFLSTLSVKNVTVVSKVQASGIEDRYWREVAPLMQ
ncbi:hypothetical protein FRB98_004605 [Tulasnella sp. 332]|nr:hypothetical protein FRB98_004605 [Tulasnella sp. 332]